MSIFSRIPEVAKAITGGVAAFAATFVPAFDDGGITTVEWITIAATTIIGALAVWAVPNKPGVPAPVEAPRRVT